MTISEVRIRNFILDLCLASGEGHLSSSFSIVEMLKAIAITQINREGLMKPESIILSKGHAAYAYYALLYELGTLSTEEFHAVGLSPSKFYGHLPYIKDDQRFQYGAGSLGHGLPYAIGLSVGSILRGLSTTSYCVLGDGEINEGTFWESLLLLGKFRPNNLKIMIDANNSSERAIPVAALIDRLKDFLVDTRVSYCDGHNVEELSRLLSEPDSALVICKTKKGYPVDYLADPRWHHVRLTETVANKIRADLK
jgi:transketolase